MVVSKNDLYELIDQLQESDHKLASSLLKYLLERTESAWLNREEGELNKAGHGPLRATGRISFTQVQESHLPEILDIYSYYVLNTTATFHAVVPSADEMRAMVMEDHPVYRTFVIYDGSQLCGYVSLVRHKNREAYDGTADISIYLRPDHIGKGIGSMALQFIEKYAADQGLHVLVSLISGENHQSITLFERNGYTKCAHYLETGRKFGRYLDVIAYQKIMG